MLTSKGFTLIETIFVLAIICILSLLIMGFHQPQKNEKMIIEEVKSFVNQAKLYAMVSKQTVTLEFEKDRLYYSSLDKEKEYLLDDDTYFDSHELSFNENGNINGAKTVNFYCHNKRYHFVFQVGSGSYYVQ